MKFTTMKQIFIFCFIIIIRLNGYSQVNLIKDVYKSGAGTLTYCYFTDTTGAYIQYDNLGPGKNIYVYDDNLSLIKTVNCGYDSIGSVNASMFLFNPDSKIELAIISFQNKLYYTYIVNEDGTLLYSFPGYSYVLNTPKGARLQTYNLTNNLIDKIYSLPGKLYYGNTGQKGDKGDKGDQGPKGDPGACNCTQTSLKSISEGSVLILSDPSPNPTSNTSEIQYDLTSTNSNCYLVFYDLKGVKLLSTLLVSRTGTFKISKDLLGSGTFIYRIENNESMSKCKKLIVE